MRLIPTYGPLTNSEATHSFLWFYAPNPHMSFCHLGHLIRVCANTLRFAQRTAGGRARSGQTSDVCKNSDKAEYKALQKLFFVLLPPQPLIALCRNSPKHKEQFSNSGRRQSPESAQKSSSEPPSSAPPPPLNPSQRCAHFYRASCVRATSCQTELHT